MCVDLYGGGVFSCRIDGVEREKHTFQLNERYAYRFAYNEFIIYTYIIYYITNDTCIHLF